MFIQIPEHIGMDGQFSIDDVFEIPDTAGFRFELHEGALRMAPPPNPAHQEAGFRLAQYFDRLGRRVYLGIGIQIDRNNYRIPDISILRPGLGVSP
jgi:Uma2 family endonuclease